MLLSFREELEIHEVLPVASLSILLSRERIIKVWMFWLICSFVVCMQQSQVFLGRGIFKFRLTNWVHGDIMTFFYKLM